MRPMTTDMTLGERRPYFFWDEDISIDELRQALAEGPLDERLRLMGKMLREARDIDVWHFVTPREVAESLPMLERRLGRRHRFWTFLIERWRRDGILAA